MIKISLISYKEYLQFYKYKNDKQIINYLTNTDNTDKFNYGLGDSSKILKINDTIQ